MNISISIHWVSGNVTFISVRDNTWGWLNSAHLAGSEHSWEDSADFRVCKCLQPTRWYFSVISWFIISISYRNMEIS